MALKKIRKLLSVLFNRQYLTVALLHRVFPSIEHNFLWSNNYRTIVDIGANNGQFTLASRKHNKESNIYAFEPLSKPAETFSSIFRDDPKVKLFRVAVGPEARRSVMNVSRSNDSSSILPISDLQNELFPNTYKDSSEEIVEETLESLLGNNEIIAPALLKIDVQGYELEVVKGSRACLDSFIHVYCECSYVPLYESQPLASEIVEYMMEAGFYLHGVYNTCYTKHGVAIQSDFLFMRNIRDPSPGSDSVSS